MWEILEERNRRLLRDIRALLALLESARTPGALSPYVRRIEDLCHQLERRTLLNLAHIALRQPTILPDLRSVTASVMQVLQLLDSRLALPILRATETDRLCLATIGWLHLSRVETANYPPAFSDGEIATWPFVGAGSLDTPLYFFPTLEQQSLLYQPLYFHEFGHLLYACHRPEMDALVGELQRTVHQLLLPASQRNDRYAARDAAQRQAVVNTWYQWTQEFFCDAVGFTIGGPCFLRAFSSYLSRLVEADFYKHRDHLRQSSHPITWLRIQFLTERAAQAGFVDLAEDLDEEWRTIADNLGIHEDYHGFYVGALRDPIGRAIADMLTETDPRPYSEAEAAGGGWSPDDDTLVRLLNWAWQRHSGDPESYADWEAQQIARLLGG